MRPSLAVLLLASVTAASALAADAASEAAADFERLRSLVGRWHGTIEWTGARTDKGEMDAEYALTGHGTAVIENLVSGGETVMTSVYHRDGPTLRMTHYCGARNQPRLKATRIDMASGAIDFAFVDSTNLKTPDAPHVVGVEL